MTLTALCAVAAFTNAHVVLSFDADGALGSLREVVSGRELVSEKVPFVSVRLKDGTVLRPDALTGAGDTLDFAFGGRGACRLRVTPFAGGWTFETAAFDVADAAWLTFARVKPNCATRKGPMSNIVEDDASAVVIRGYTPDLEMNETDWRGINEGVERSRDTWCAVKAEFGFVGKRCGLSAGPRRDILEMLKGMADASGLRVNRAAGPWSRTAEVNRRASLFATWMDYESLDDWIRLLDKAGCQTLHFHAWWKTRGHYEPDVCFPGGLPQMREAVRRVHAAGKHATTHSLAAAVQFGDPFISPEWFDDFVTFRSYTLARPYRAGDGVLYVNEQPWERHAKVLTGNTLGNVLRLGDDLLQYDDFSRTPPYRFTGVRMALQPFGEEETYDNTQAVSRDVEAFGAEKGERPSRTLSRASYPAGARVDYLNQRCAEFFPRPGSRLAERVMGVVSNFFHFCGFEGIYLDGTEPWGTRESLDRMRYETSARLCGGAEGGIFCASSCRQPFDWWMRSIVGAWDHPTHGPRAFHDRHIRMYRDECAADYCAVDLGWWNTQEASADGRGYYPEEMEYFGCKSAANDMTVSIMGARVTDGPLGFQMDDQLTLAGWWSSARSARAFRDGLPARLAVPGEDWRMRQDAKGRWTVRPLAVDCHKVSDADDARWRVASPSARPAELRVAALYGADHSDAAPRLRLLDASHEKDLSLTSAPGVRAAFEVADDPAHGRVLRLSADNETAPRDAAWVGLGRQLPEKTYVKVNGVSSLWVKGDGSGAVLNVQVQRAPEFAQAFSENFVRLDFTGWRRIDLLIRERDPDTTVRYRWPYVTERLNTPGAIFRCAIGGKTANAFTFWLNDIPPGGRAEVCLGAWESVPQTAPVLPAGATVRVNGAPVAVPFALASGEWAELRDGAWWRYAESGEPKERRVSGEAVALRAGENDLSFEPAKGAPWTRVEVTTLAPGADEPAFAPLTEEQKRLLCVEYERPRLLDPSAGLTGPFDVRVRPGERARLGFEILGPVKDPAVLGRVIPVTLADAQERVRCDDGRTWVAERVVPGACGPENRLKAARREVIAKGAFGDPLPSLLGGTMPVDVTAASASGARVTLFKRY